MIDHWRFVFIFYYFFLKKLNPDSISEIFKSPGLVMYMKDLTKEKKPTTFAKQGLPDIDHHTLIGS